MIVDVTYEGNRLFKVWPVPDATEIKSIIGRIMAQDPSNAPAIDMYFPIQYNETDQKYEDGDF